MEFEQWANKVWNISGSGVEVSLKDFRKDIIIEVYNDAGQLVIAYKVYRCWVPSSRPSRFGRQRQCGRHPAHQAGERRLGGRERYGTDGTFLHGAGGWVMTHAPTVGYRVARHMGARLTALPFERALAILSAASPESSPAALARLSIGRRDANLLQLREWAFGSELAISGGLPVVSPAGGVDDAGFRAAGGDGPGGFDRELVDAAGIQKCDIAHPIFPRILPVAPGWNPPRAGRSYSPPA